MMTSLCKDFLSIIVILTILLSSSLTFSATGTYYYLHVASFKTEQKANQSVKKFQRHGLNAVVNKENVPKKGVWYRIYIGPFSSQQEAKLKASELKNEGIIDYAAVKKKDAPSHPAKDDLKSSTPFYPDKSCERTYCSYCLEKETPKGQKETVKASDQRRKRQKRTGGQCYPRV
jgi:hypothetical protein